MGGGMSVVNVPQVQLPDGFTAIITGGHQGLGYEVSKYLALLGARVIIASETESQGKAAILRIQADAIEIRGKVDGQLGDYELNGDSSSRDSDMSREEVTSALKVEFMKLDFHSLDNVTHFSEQYKAKGYPLHLLVCNSSVVAVPKGYTEDGYEMHFQLNYLGHFLLCLHMIPLLRESGEELTSRIVMVSSKEHTSGEFSPKTAQGRGQYNKDKYYANSKFCQILHMYALQRRLEGRGVATYAVHGGAIDTALKKHMDDPAAWGSVYNVGRSLGKIMSNMAKNVSNCLGTCLSPQLLELRGSYFVDGVPLMPAIKTRDIKTQEILWRYSVENLQDQVNEHMLADLTITAKDIEAELETK